MILYTPDRMRQIGRNWINLIKHESLQWKMRGSGSPPPAISAEELIRRIDDVIALDDDTLRAKQLKALTSIYPGVNIPSRAIARTKAIRSDEPSIRKRNGPR